MGSALEPIANLSSCGSKSCGKRVRNVEDEMKDITFEDPQTVITADTSTRVKKIDRPSLKENVRKKPQWNEKAVFNWNKRDVMNWMKSVNRVTRKSTISIKKLRGLCFDNMVGLPVLAQKFFVSQINIMKLKYTLKTKDNKHLLFIICYALIVKETTLKMPFPKKKIAVLERFITLQYKKLDIISIDDTKFYFQYPEDKQKKIERELSISSLCEKCGYLSNPIQLMNRIYHDESVEEVFGEEVQVNLVLGKNGVQIKYGTGVSSILAPFIFYLYDEVALRIPKTPNGFGFLHLSLTIGKYLFSWDAGCIIEPRGINTNHTQFVVPLGRISTKKDWKRRICELVCLWNTEYKYVPIPSKKKSSKNGNCQTFVNALTQRVNVKLENVVKEQKNRHERVSLMAKWGDIEKRLDINEEFYGDFNLHRFKDERQTERGKKIFNKKKRRVVFSSHSDLDRFAHHCMIELKKVKKKERRRIEDRHRDVLDLLLCFDLAFWFNFLGYEDKSRKKFHPFRLNINSKKFPYHQCPFEEFKEWIPRKVRKENIPIVISINSECEPCEVKLLTREGKCKRDDDEEKDYLRRNEDDEEVEEEGEDVYPPEE